MPRMDEWCKCERYWCNSPIREIRIYPLPSVQGGKAHYTFGAITVNIKGTPVHEFAL
jgi:hypothetical protein